MAESQHILILEDNPADAELIQFELEEAGFVFAAKVVMTEEDFVRELQEFSPDLILSDYDLPQYNGALALAEAKRRRPDTPFILVSGAVTEDRAIDILTQGAKDYVLKNRLQQRLVPAVRRALAEAQEHRARKQAEEELLRATQILYAISKYSPALVFAKDIQCRLVYASESTLRALGKSAAEVLGKTDVEFHADPRLGEAVMENDRIVRETLRPLVVEEPTRLPDGTVRVFHSTKVPWIAEDGKLVGTFGISVDITELKLAEKALKDANETLEQRVAERVADLKAEMAARKKVEEENQRLLANAELERDRLSALICSITDEIWFADDEQRLTLMNPAVDKEFGSCVVEGMEVEKIAAGFEVYRSDGTPRPVDEAPPLRALRGEMVTKEEEIVLIPARGERRTREVTATPVRDVNGAIIGSVSVVRDITEQKKAENLLKANLAALMRMHALSTKVLERGGHEPMLQEIMQAAVAIMAAEKGTLQMAAGDSLRIVAHCGHERPFLDFFAAAENVASVCGEATKRGERVIVEDVEMSPLFAGTPSLSVLRNAGVRAVQSTPLMSREGKLLGILTTQWGVPYVPDEHDLWRIDLLARQAAEIIEHVRVQEALKERTQQLEDANKELESFSYSVSHDLKAPLRAIDGYFRMFLKKYGSTLDDDALRMISAIRGNTRKMDALIDDLLSFSKVLQSGMTMTEIDMDKLAGEVWDDIRAANQERDLEFKITNLLPGFGDRALIRQALSNLILNAVKFTKNRQPGVIEISSYPEPGEIVYRVKDNGIGFDMAFYDKLFSVFQRLHGDEEYEGTGVGMAIVQRIIHRHGGRVWAEGEVDKGATFYFTLPRGENTATLHVLHSLHE